MLQQILGGIKVDRVAEIDRIAMDYRWLFPSAPEELIAAHAEALGPALVEPVTYKLGMSFHSFLIRANGLNILVDTCNGNHKSRPTALWQHQFDRPDFLQNLARFALRPEDIHIVLCTHLHTDHVGWNTRLLDGRWIPTFPNARYFMAKQEYEHFERLYNARPEKPVNHGSFADSVLPVVESGQAHFVDIDHTLIDHLDDNIWLEPAPGHTPGHVMVHLKGGGCSAIMSGDILHHPIQLHEASLVSLAEADAALARRTRESLIARCTDADILLLASHFISPTAGRIKSLRGHLKFEFCNHE